MTSLYSGGAVTGLGGATYSVTAGTGVIVSQTLVQAEPTHIDLSFNAVTGVTPLYTNGIIYVNSSGSVLQLDVSTVPLTTAFKKQNVILAGYLYVGFIAALENLSSTPILTASKLEDLSAAIGPLNISGNVYSANGANLSLNRSAGETFRLKSNIGASKEVRDQTVDVAEAPVANAAGIVGYRNLTGGFDFISYTGITPDVYDDGSGTPVAVPNNKYTIQRIYFINNPNTSIIYLGQTLYSSLANASAAIDSETRAIDKNTQAATFRCSLVLKKGTTALNSATDAVFFEGTKFGAAGAGGGAGTATLQSAYNNSTTPEIVTNAALGAISLQRGSAADTDNIYEGKNGAGTTTFNVTGAGVVSGSNLSGTNTGDNAVNSLYSGLVSNATHTGDATGSVALTVVRIQSKAFPTLSGADDQKFPKYVSGSNAFVMTSITGTGTVTDVSVVSANGFAGTVATSTSTPAITLTTSVAGLLKGNATAISAAVAGTDYQVPITSGDISVNAGNATLKWGKILAVSNQYMALN
jgi:hypothetical protein